MTFFPKSQIANERQNLWGLTLPISKEYIQTINHLKVDYNHNDSNLKIYH